MIYCIDSDAVTLAAANTTKGAIGTIKLVNGFWNPTTSNVNAVIYAIQIATVSGTPAGPFYWNYLSAYTPTNTATGTIRQALLNGATTGQSLMIPETGVVLTQTSGTPALIQCGTVGGPAAVAAGVGVYSQEVNYWPSINGSNFLIVPPGTVFGLAATGAGTSHVVQTTLYWEEFPA